MVLFFCPVTFTFEGHDLYKLAFLGHISVTTWQNIDK